MRTLLLACLLLVAGPVYAEEMQSIVEVPMPDPAYLLTNEELAELAKVLKSEHNAKLRVHIVKDPCLARMEEALKAVEPWLGYTYKDDTNPADFKKAKALFYAVKNECWSKP